MIKGPGLEFCYPPFFVLAPQPSPPLPSVVVTDPRHQSVENITFLQKSIRGKSLPFGDRHRFAQLPNKVS